MRFKLDKNADSNGTSLQKRCPQWVTTRELAKRFGAFNLEGCDEEKGYGDGYVFSNESGNTVTLYPRWGCYRIGALELDTAERFEIWLCAQGIGEFRD